MNLHCVKSYFQFLDRLIQLSQTHTYTIYSWNIGWRKTIIQNKNVLVQIHALLIYSRTLLCVRKSSKENQFCRKRHHCTTGFIQIILILSPLMTLLLDRDIDGAVRDVSHQLLFETTKIHNTKFIFGRHLRV